MLNDVTFSPEMNKSVYRTQRDELSERLMVLQQQAKAAGLGSVVIFEGWHAAGKGACISDLVVNLDPRLYLVHSLQDPVGYESRMPFMARFWSRVGAHGTMTIFDRAYYDALSRSYVDEIRHVDEIADSRSAREALAKLARTRIEEHIESARSFERQLQADGYLVVRFFLHILKDEQSRRTINLLTDPESSWKVDERDLSQLQHYDEYYNVFDHWLSDKRMGAGRWHVVPSLYRRNANIQIMHALVDEMTEALEARGFDTSQPIPAGDGRHEHVVQVAVSASSATEGPEEAEGGEAGTTAKAEPQVKDKGTGTAPTAPATDDVEKPAGKECRRPKDVIGSAKDIKSRFKLVEVPSLDEVRHDRHLPAGTYHRTLDAEQQRLSELSLTLYRRRIPLIIAYEGWDAAGKGGNIKRVAAALDARSYHVHPISAPTSDELAHPFLWRFWTRLPRTGHVAIFDRTWYGRVLVERVEGFAKPDEWRRAYDEINEFEEDLHAWGAVLVKFWIDVSSEEQLRRFRDREQDPARRWKITDEDWRNRAKNDLYRRCVNDMLRLTSTEYAPWTVVESDDKHFARVKALKVINTAIERRLEG